MVSFRQLGLVNAFTLEASFGGGAAGSSLAGTHFNTGGRRTLGMTTTEGMLQLARIQPALTMASKV